MYQQLIKDFIQQERLPSTYLLDATQYFLPLVRDIKAEIQSSRKGPFLIGINGEIAERTAHEQRVSHGQPLYR